MADELAPPPPVASGPRGRPPDTPLRAVLVTLVVCAVCSALVATAVVMLRPYQSANRERDRERRIRDLVASVPGIGDLLGAFGGSDIEARVVELETGRYADEIDPGSFDAREAERIPEQSIALPSELDLAGIGRRATHATVYLVSQGRVLRMIVLPVHGAGYVSTLYGYLALDADGSTIRGLSFFEHAETPGLGSEIENPRWLALFQGKSARDESGAVRIRVARGRVDPAGPDAAYEVDGISGATRTSQGVANLLRFWLGPSGFGPYLERIAREGGPAPHG